jgi:cell shape-determining protein MreC
MSLIPSREMSEKQVSKIYLTILWGLLSIIGTGIGSIVLNVQYTRDTVRDVKIRQEQQLERITELKELNQELKDSKLNKEAFDYYKIDLNNQLTKINESLIEIKGKL